MGISLPRLPLKALHINKQSLVLRDFESIFCAIIKCSADCAQDDVATVVSELLIYVASIIVQSDRWIAFNSLVNTFLQHGDDQAIDIVAWEEGIQSGSPVYLSVQIDQEFCKLGITLT